MDQQENSARATNQQIIGDLQAESRQAAMEAEMRRRLSYVKKRDEAIRRIQTLHAVGPKLAVKDHSATLDSSAAPSQSNDVKCA
jgi:hypothetical protein